MINYNDDDRYLIEERIAIMVWEGKTAFDYAREYAEKELININRQYSNSQIINNNAQCCTSNVEPKK